MELKKYQQQILDDLKLYLEHVQDKKDASKAFKSFWENHPRTPFTPKEDGYVTPYKIPTIKGSNVKINAPHICIKVPTGGGKTFIAAAALNTIFSSFDESCYKMVVWLVPSNSILEQTYKNLSNASHPYRQRINSDFQNRVEVISKEEALQGVNFNKDSIKENLTIIVMSYDSLRSANKEGRNVYKENGYLASFKELFGDSDSASTMVQVLQKVHPVVIVDESHNAESDLSIDMLQQLDPNFILDLTATPKKNSNIISFTNASELKSNNMVKLPVIVYNLQNKNEVIESALQLQKSLEKAAIEEKGKGGNNIRPIVLFQAQPKTKDDNITFEKIKDILLKIGIKEEQIKIKTSTINELEGLNLMDKDCPVRYIITVNALKEGWDCPFAYILASLADKSSQVDVEQILGRILRMPYVRKNNDQMLNMSYVLTASALFNATLENIVKGLNKAGFSGKDYRVATGEDVTEGKGNEQTFDPGSLFAEPQQTKEEINTSDPDSMSAEEISFNPEDSEKKETQTDSDTNDIANNGDDKDEKTKGESVVEIIKQRAEEEAKKEEEEKKHMEDGETHIPPELDNVVKKYKIKEQFKEVAEAISIPQFMKMDEEKVNNTIFDIESIEKIDKLFDSNFLLKDFHLERADINIDFSSGTSTMYKVDIDAENENRPGYIKIEGKDHQKIVEYILSPETNKQRIPTCIRLLKNNIGKMYPIPDQDIENYIGRIIRDFTDEQIADLVNRNYTYSDKIKSKIKSLSEDFKETQFRKLLDMDKIECKPFYRFEPEITLSDVKSGMSKTLYQEEGTMDGFEWEVIQDVICMDNVLFWTRNNSRQGFVINGFINHYPDFIIVTKNGKVVVLETKGDHLDAEKKILLGNLWATRAGSKFKYCLVYKDRKVDGAYTKDEFLELMKEW